MDDKFILRGGQAIRLRFCSNRGRRGFLQLVEVTVDIQVIPGAIRGHDLPGGGKRIGSEPVPP